VVADVAREGDEAFTSGGGREADRLGEGVRAATDERDAPPSAASWWTTARPTPLPAPVTRATGDGAGRVFFFMMRGRGENAAKVVVL
jgi:hypothetical protein